MRRLHGRTRKGRRDALVRAVAAGLIVLLVAAMALGGILAGVR
jgi:hypothetical protein